MDSRVPDDGGTPEVTLEPEVATDLTSGDHSHLVNIPAQPGAESAHPIQPIQPTTADKDDKSTQTDRKRERQPEEPDSEDDMYEEAMADLGRWVDRNHGIIPSLNTVRWELLPVWHHLWHPRAYLGEPPGGPFDDDEMDEDIALEIYGF